MPALNKSAQRNAGRSFFFMLALALSQAAFLRPAEVAGPGGAAEALSGSAAFDETRQVDVQGLKVHYFQEDGLLTAEGSELEPVVLESAGSRLYARHLTLNMKDGLLDAHGKVVWTEGGNTVYAETIHLKLGDKTGKATGLVLEQGPWLAAGDSAEKPNATDAEMRNCEASSCRKRNAHWRLSAGRIKVRLGERLWAWNVVLRTGRVPVFYVPFYTQSLKDPRPPFEIKPGYTRTLGAYVRTAYNYYLTDDQWGSVRYDWMDKKGSGYGLGHHYRMLGGEGEISGFYTSDKNDPSRSDWNGSFRHQQRLGQGLSLVGSIDLLSNYDVGQNYDIGKVDSFQRRSYAALQSSQQDHAWIFQTAETQVLQVVSGPGGSVETATREYVVVERQLPGFTYNQFSRPLWEGSSLYWGFDGQFGRRLVVPQSFLFAQGVSVYDTEKSYYISSASLTPQLSNSFRLPWRSSLNANTGYSQAYERLDTEDGPGRGVSSYNTGLTLQNRPGWWATTELGHRYSRRLSQQDTQRFAGETINRLEARLNLQPGEDFSTLVTGDYDLLPYRTDSDLKRLGLLRLQASYNPSEHRGANSNFSWHLPSSQWKTVDGSINLNDPKKRWRLNLGGNWVNNRILPRPASLDVNAPYELVTESPRATADQFLGALRLSLALSETWSLSWYERADLANRRMEERALSLWRQLHCWDLELYFRETRLGGLQAGFALALRALPDVRASSNKVTQELFEPVQYGY